MAVVAAGPVPVSPLLRGIDHAGERPPGLSSGRAGGWGGTRRGRRGRRASGGPRGREAAPERGRAEGPARRAPGPGGAGSGGRVAELPPLRWGRAESPAHPPRGRRGEAGIAGPRGLGHPVQSRPPNMEEDSGAASANGPKAPRLLPLPLTGLGAPRHPSSTPPSQLHPHPPALSSRLCPFVPRPQPALLPACFLKLGSFLV